MDVRPITGRNKLHPKVYVDLFYHAMYPEQKNEGLKKLTGDAYWYLPVQSDLIKSQELGELLRSLVTVIGSSFADCWGLSLLRRL